MRALAQTLHRKADALASVRGLRRAGACAALGAMGALAFPPVHALPLLALAFPALAAFWLRAQTGRAALGVVFWFALGFLTVSLHWTAGAILVEIASFWWALPFAIFGLPAALALYYALAATLAHRAWRHPLALALAWFAADMARAHLLTGFPWDILGYAFASEGTLAVLQLTSLIGIEGLSLLTALWAMGPALALHARSPQARRIILAGLLASFLGAAAWGSVRLGAATDMVAGAKLRLVQPHTDQGGKWDREKRWANFDRLLDLSFEGAGEAGVTHILWPETATAFYLAEEDRLRADIAARMPEGAVLLTGAVRRQADPNGGQTRYYNSLLILDARGNVIGGYDKHHLVPFGEYMPGRSVLPIRVINAFGRDFTPGPGPLTLRAPGLPPLSGLVCYEAIFSGEVAETGDRPALLVNVTNDAWYEGTIGPAQHFAISRVRAVEEGLPMARIANKGVTAMIDPFGRIVAQTPAGRAGVVDAPLPQPLPQTVFSLWRSGIK